MKTQRWVVMAVFMSLCLLNTSCISDNMNRISPQSKPNQTESDDPQKERQRTFAIVYPVAHPFFEGVTNSARKAAEEMDAEVIIRAPEATNANQQIQIVENLIKKEVDGIAIGPTDPAALTPFINKAVDAGIKVICFDTDAPESDRLSYIGTDNLEAGKHLGEVVARLLDYKGKVIGSTGISTMLNLSTRVKGVKQTLNQYPQVHLVEMRSSDGVPGKAVSNIEDMIEEHPDFDALIGMDSLSGPAAIMVWKARGIDKPVVTFDDLPVILEGIENGQITGTISQQQFLWGELILKRLNEASNGKDIPLFEKTETTEVNAVNLERYKKRSSTDTP